MANSNPHVVLEMSDEPDCRFVAAWLAKVAEAQTLWSEALRDPQFNDRTLLLHAYAIPDLGAAALEILGELEHHCHVATLDLNEDEIGVFSTELGLLVELGFFVADGRSYWMAVPDEVTLTAVKLAAAKVLSTAGDLGLGIDELQPERQLQTLSAIEAQAWRSTQILMRRLSDRTFRHSSGQ